MKPTIEQDEMFPEGVIPPNWEMEESGSGGSIEVASERTVHSDFFNAFDDIFDDEDLA